MITRIYLNANSLRQLDELKKVLEKINSMDQTFMWRIDGRYLLIESPTKDLSVRRGLWCIHKIKALANHRFRVE